MILLSTRVPRALSLCECLFGMRVLPFPLSLYPSIPLSLYPSIPLPSKLPFSPLPFPALYLSSISLSISLPSNISLSLAHASFSLALARPFAQQRVRTGRADLLHDRVAVVGEKVVGHLVQTVPCGGSGHRYLALDYQTAFPASRTIPP